MQLGLKITEITEQKQNFGFQINREYIGKYENDFFTSKGE